MIEKENYKSRKMKERGYDSETKNILLDVVVKKEEDTPKNTYEKEPMTQ